MIELIRLAVKKNIKCRGKHTDCVDYMNPIFYAKEFKTIHLNIGRGTGKSTAIATLASPGDLIVVHNSNRARIFKVGNPTCFAKIVSISDVAKFPEENIDSYNYVWIDEPSLCDDFHDIDIVYGRIHANLYIKLGE